MEALSDEIRSLFDLKFGMDYLFFKSFEVEFDFPEKLNSTHMRTLMNLRFHGPQLMSDISRFMLLEKGSFTPVANKLIHMGYIEKIQDKNDKRKYLLKSTEKGRTLAEKFASEHLSFIGEKLSALTEGEQEDYFSLMRQLNKLTLKIEDHRPPCHPQKTHKKKFD